MIRLPHTKVTPIDYTFEDKSGRTITFEFHEDCEGPNRGFTVDLLVAFSGNEKVGHLRTIYQDSAKVEEFFPSGILNYIDQTAGKAIFDGVEGHGKPATDLRTANPELLAKTARRLVLTQLTSNAPTKPLQTYDQFQEWFDQEEASSRTLQGLRVHYDKMLKTLDQHTVDFVETIPDVRGFNGILHDNSGLGIATALYKVLGKELAKKGHRLHSGYHQQPAAAAIWNKLRDEGITENSAVFIMKYETKTEPAVMRLTINPDAYELTSGASPRL